MTAGRYAIIRDPDNDLYPLGVLFETEHGEARLDVFGGSAYDIGVKEKYDCFDAAVRIWGRQAVISAVGKEGE